MRTRKSIRFGFSSVFALVLALAGFAASASGQTASLSGTVHGGFGAISGAEVTLYAAGTAYGANATSLGQTTTDSSGNFTVLYAPRPKPAVLYLIARGGNAGVGANPAIGLMGVAGMSNALPAAVTINALTTVAAEWALAQFIDANGRTIGAPASNATGLANAANQAQANLVDITTGGPASFWANQGATGASCTGASPPLNCDGLERLDTFANILAACVASAGTCDSLAVAHEMATNPFANGWLFGLQSSSPFMPTLSTAPDGWEIALNFPPSYYVGIPRPVGMAIDANGNVWVTNYFGDSVTELTASGAFVGNFDPSGSVSAPSNPAIDAAGNVWVVNSGNGYNCCSVTELTAGGGLVGNFDPSGALTAGAYGIAIDVAGDAWVTDPPATA